MLPSMSRPANPHDNATCESFLKTLKREETYAGTYRDFEGLEERVEKVYKPILQPAPTALSAEVLLPGGI